MSSGATKDRLVQSAWAVIRDEGLDAATSRRITDKAGANLQSITYHFGSKNELLREALVDQLRSWSEPLTNAIHAGPDDADRDTTVAAAVASTIARFAEQGDDVRAILRALLSDRDLPGVRDAFARWLGDFRTLVVSSMETQQKAGLIPADVDVRALAGTFTALGIGVIAQSDLDPGAPAVPDLVAQFLRLLVRPEP
ncbi:MAG: TetR/AcrR family transcriptional regulator [Microthrixaceae bacterium]